MLSVSPGWNLDVERGPACLVVTVDCEAAHSSEAVPLADWLGALLDEHLVNRIVLDLHGLPLLHSALVGQLVELNRRLKARDGWMRLCGLSAQNERVLRTCRVQTRLPAYRDRSEAVWATSPGKPR